MRSGGNMRPLYQTSKISIRRRLYPQSTQGRSSTISGGTSGCIRVPNSKATPRRFLVRSTALSADQPVPSQKSISTRSRAPISVNSAHLGDVGGRLRSSDRCAPRVGRSCTPGGLARILRAPIRSGRRRRRRIWWRCAAATACGRRAGHGHARASRSVSHCWRIESPTDNALPGVLRAIQTGILFTGDLDVTMRFDFAPWRASCRLQDARDVARFDFR